MRRRFWRWIGRWLLGLPNVDAPVSRTLRIGVDLVERLRERLDPTEDPSLWELSKQFLATAAMAADTLDRPNKPENPL